MVDQHTASVLIATYRSPDSLQRVVRAVLDQLRGDDELIVVDDGSGDHTPTLLRSIGDPRLTVIVQDNQGVSAARNHGAKAATNRLLIFLDDDEVPSSGWLEAHRAAHRTRHRVAMGRAELVVPGGLGSRVIAGPSEAAATEAPSVLVNDSFSVPREDFEAVGGFDTRFVHGGEDIDLGLRLVAAGSELVYANGAVIRHEIDRTYRDFRRQRLRRGEASALLEARHGVGLVASHLTLSRRDRPWALVAARSPVAAEVVSLCLWGILRLAGLFSIWRVQAAAAGRITVMLGVIGRSRAAPGCLGEATRAADHEPGGAGQ